MENFFNIELNEEQKNAMLATEGAVLVTAGAGSGKTRLLTQRILYLIKEKNIAQENILAITFTNKASKEMKERVEKLLGGTCSVWISTIHSMCATILRYNIAKLGTNLDSHFSIYGPDDSHKVIKQILNKDKQEKEDDDGSIKQIDYHLSNMKNKDIPLEQYAKEIEGLSNAENIISCIQEYQNILISNNALDFDDLLVYTKRLLAEIDDVREYYQKRFKYILVDEFQDTNIVQYNIIKLLAGYHKNIFVVGDEDQCIYGWRGANIENIKNFIQDYEDCQVFKLEKNYRSTKNILKLANQLIEKNTERIPKTLYTDNEEGRPVIFRTFNSDKDEAEYVARCIYTLHQQGIEYKDMAVLMRLNALSRNFEEKLMLYNIPYSVYGGFKFYDRAEIKIMLSYLRFISNTNDMVSLEKIINFPKRGIGDTTVNKIANIFLVNADLNLIDILKNIDSYSEFNASSKLKIKDFYNLISSCIDYSKTSSVSETLDYIYRNSGIKELYKDKSEESINRTMNIQNLIASAQEFEESFSEADIEKYLQSVTLVSDIDASDGYSDNVTLATVHAVKGLEFKIVFVVGLEQKVFPIIRDEVLDEEERRLMYVAMTRAKEQLYLSNCTDRFMYGKTDKMTPSIFLQELGFVSKNAFEASANKIKVKNYGIKSYFDENEYDEIQDRSLDIKNFTNKKPLSELNASKYGGIRTKAESKTGFNIGDRVNHAHYGEGIVVAIEGNGSNKMVKVNFETVGIKSLLLDFAPITRI